MWIIRTNEYMQIKSTWTLTGNSGLAELRTDKLLWYMLMHLRASLPEDWWTLPMIYYSLFYLSNNRFYPFHSWNHFWQYKQHQSKTIKTVGMFQSTHCNWKLQKTSVTIFLCFHETCYPQLENSLAQNNASETAPGCDKMQLCMECNHLFRSVFHIL